VHIVLPAFDDFQCAVFLEDNGSGFGVLFINLAIGRGNGCDKSIYVGHGLSFFAFGVIEQLAAGARGILRRLAVTFSLRPK
jgi:hypothetical protein